MAELVTVKRVRLSSLLSAVSAPASAEKVAPKDPEILFLRGVANEAAGDTIGIGSVGGQRGFEEKSDDAEQAGAPRRPSSPLLEAVHRGAPPPA